MREPRETIPVKQRLPRRRNFQLSDSLSRNLNIRCVTVANSPTLIMNNGEDKRDAEKQRRHKVYVRKMNIARRIDDTSH